MISKNDTIPNDEMLKIIEKSFGFLDDICAEFQISLEMAIAMVMNAAHMKGGDYMLYVMKDLTNVLAGDKVAPLLSKNALGLPVNRHERRAQKKSKRS